MSEREFDVVKDLEMLRTYARELEQVRQNQTSLEETWYRTLDLKWEDYRRVHTTEEEIEVAEHYQPILDEIATQLTSLDTEEQRLSDALTMLQEVAEERQIAALQRWLS